MSCEGISDSSRMFLIRAFEKILNEKDIKKSHYAQLRKSCEESLAEIKQEIKNPASSDNVSSVLPSGKSMSSIDANKYFIPFQLACQTENNRIIEISLDCIQKLIAHGHLTGNCIDPINADQLLIDRIIKTVCECFRGDLTSENVQLQIIKALLTMLTSHYVEVHQAPLLLAVKTCFNICLVSKNIVNQTTAKATLTQILNLIFMKMEQSANVELYTKQNDLNTSISVHSSSVTKDALSFSEKSSGYESPSYEVEEASAHKDLTSHHSESSTDVEACVSDLIDDIISFLLTGEYDGENYSQKDAEHRLPNSYTHPDAYRFQDKNFKPAHRIEFENIYQKDAYYVFKSLCRISQRNFPEIHNESRMSIDLRSKILALQLLLTILQGSGPIFRSSPIFLSVVRNQLCVSLSANGVSSVPEVFELSLAIFVALLANFKQHLKLQIEVFFKEILLTILETSTSSFKHKWILVQALSAICSDMQIVMDLYVNYDCNLRSSNIFERLINDISRISQGRQALELGCTPSEEKSLRIKGLESLVLILKSMVAWTKDSNEKKTVNNSGDTTLKRSDSYSSLNSATTSGMGYDPSDIEAEKQIKEVVECGIEMFNVKPSKGLQFLQENRIIENSADDVAKFLHAYEYKLKKSVVGEFLGGIDRFCKEVMFAYVDQIDFTGVDFLTALRRFLAGFRLPGEAQKIDRLMEKFAARYCECNPNLEMFATADAAYVLAYSIIMLTTDLHSSQVKKKMTKEQYIKMNRGINDSQNLPEAYLSTIYDEIASEEIKMKYNETEKKGKLENIPNERHRKILFDIEMEHVHQIAKSLMENAGAISDENFTIASYAEHVGPMFKVVWSPALAAFSIGLQDSDNSQTIELCLTGIACAIKIAGLFRLETERDAFVQALSRFTSLNATSPLSDMKAKNVKCIKTLIYVAHENGNYLGKSWHEILRCISQLELAQLIGSTGLHTKHSMNVLHRDNSFLDRAGFHDARKLSAFQEQLVETNSQRVVVAVDRIFTSSVSFDGEAIVDFVKALCAVSTDELIQNPPRTFCLQKIIEISYYNMDRIRLQWSRIWVLIADHFNKAGTSNNVNVATFAVDSLRQLSLKFLEKEEFTNFHFQKDFLRPFEYIIKRTNSNFIKDMVVRCINVIINVQAKNIKSGWKNILEVILIASMDTEAGIVELAFQTSCFIVSDLFPKYFSNMVESFQDFIKCLSEFVCNPYFPDISMESLKLILSCCFAVSRNPQLFHDHFGEEVLNVPPDDRVWVRGWFPILFELSCIINRCKLDIRTRALTILFEMMKTFGTQFKKEWWMESFVIVFRIFEKLPETEAEKIDWITTTCNHALYAVIDILCQYYDTLECFLVKDVYRILLWCLEQGNEQIARSAIKCFENFISYCGSKFSDDLWGLTCTHIRNLFKSVMPHDAVVWKSHVKTRENGRNVGNIEGDLSLVEIPLNTGHHTVPLFQILAIKSLVWMELIHAVSSIVLSIPDVKEEDSFLLSAIEEHSKFNRVLNPINLVLEEITESKMYLFMKYKNLIQIVECLLESYRAAKAFSNDDEFKEALPIDLMSVQVESFGSAIRILFKMYEDSQYTRNADELLRMINTNVADCLLNFIYLDRDKPNEMWQTVIIYVMSGYFRISDEVVFRKSVLHIYELLCWLISLPVKAQLRHMLTQVFLRLKP